MCDKDRETLTKRADSSLSGHHLQAKKNNNGLKTQILRIGPTFKLQMLQLMAEAAKVSEWLAVYPTLSCVVNTNGGTQK